MPDRWLFDMGGRAAYFQRGKCLFSATTHKCEYREQAGYLYEMKGGCEPSYVIRANFVYDMHGRPMFYLGPTSVAES